MRKTKDPNLRKSCQVSQPADSQMFHDYCNFNDTEYKQKKKKATNLIYYDLTETKEPNTAEKVVRKKKVVNR